MKLNNLNKYYVSTENVSITIPDALKEMQLNEWQCLSL